MIEEILETGRRAASWTAGPTVVLADGSVWFLPRLDLALLATQPDLATDLRRLLDLERDLAGAEPGSLPGSRWAVARLEAYHLLAGRLLALNYDLATDEWAEVLPDDRGAWFHDLVCFLGDAIILALMTDWRGLTAAYLGSDAAAAVLSN